MIVRPAILYASAIWRAPAGMPAHSKQVESKLKIIQNGCLRIVAGAFKATPIPVLEAETFVEPLTNYMNKTQAKFRIRMIVEKNDLRTQKACDKIQKKLRKQTGRRRKAGKTPGTYKHKWFTAIMTDHADIPKSGTEVTAPWNQPTEEETTAQRMLQADKANRHKQLDRHFLTEWKRQWGDYQQSIQYPTAAQHGELGKKRLKLHEGMEKALSSLATQIRSEKIGLAYFLFRRRVPGVTSGACQCGYPRQTAKHMLIFCPLHADRRDLILAGPLDYNYLTGTHTGLKAAATWLMRTKILAQFSVAEELLE